MKHNLFPAKQGSLAKFIRLSRTLNQHVPSFLYRDYSFLNPLYISTSIVDHPHFSLSFYSLTSLAQP
jgi:hypothetical protein